MGLFDKDDEQLRYRELAKELGATIVHGRNPPALAKDGIVVRFEEKYFGRLNEIRWRAELPLPGIPAFRIYPEGFQSFISKLFGGDDLEIGHNAFDVMFMVKAREPELVKRLWTDGACDLLVGLRDAWIEGDDQEIVLRQRLEFGFLPDLVPGIQLLFALGAVDLYGRDALRALPEAQWQPERGEAWLPGPGNLRLGFIRSGDVVSTAIWASSEIVPEIPADVSASFSKLGAGISKMGSSPGAVLVVWGGVRPDPAKIVDAIDALRRFVGGVPGDGIFR